MIGQYLIHSFIYYQLHDNVISDYDYDQLCQDILDKWDLVEHPHKHLITKEALKAGSGYHLKWDDYPRPVRRIATLILDWRDRGKDYIKWLEERYD